MIQGHKEIVYLTSVLRLRLDVVVTTLRILMAVRCGLW